MWLSLAEEAIPTFGNRPEYYEMVQRLLDLYIYIGEMKDRPEFHK